MTDRFINQLENALTVASPLFGLSVFLIFLMFLGFIIGDVLTKLGLDVESRPVDRLLTASSYLGLPGLGGIAGAALGTVLWMLVWATAVLWPLSVVPLAIVTVGLVWFRRPFLQFLFAMGKFIMWTIVALALFGLWFFMLRVIPAIRP